MSLMKTLAKVAIGMAVAKGVSSMTGKGRAAPNSGGGLLEVLMGGGGQQQAGRASTQGGLGGLLGGLTKGGRNLGGGLGGLLGGLLGAGTGAAAAAAPQADSQRSFGDKFNQSLTHGNEPDVPPTPQQEIAAGLMLRAMIQAAKSDGKIDEAEREKLLGKLGDISPQERDFVNAELAAEIDVKGLARQVPNGMEAQVYAMSIMGIDLDNQNEAQYLHGFATALGIGKPGVNHIHDQLGVPSIYA